MSKWTLPRHLANKTIQKAFEDDDIILDTLKAWVRQMNPDQLSAFWKWIMLEYVQRCRQEYEG